MLSCGCPDQVLRIAPLFQPSQRQRRHFWIYWLVDFNRDVDKGSNNAHVKRQMRYKGANSQTTWYFDVLEEARACRFCANSSVTYSINGHSWCKLSRARVNVQITVCLSVLTPQMSRPVQPTLKRKLTLDIYAMLVTCDNRTAKELTFSEMTITGDITVRLWCENKMASAHE